MTGLEATSDQRILAVTQQRGSDGPLRRSLTSQSKTEAVSVLVWSWTERTGWRAAEADNRRTANAKGNSVPNSRNEWSFK